MIDTKIEYVIDIEANGLLHEATQIWCLAYRPYSIPDVETKVIIPGDIHFLEILRGLSQCRGIVGHNIITYDIPLLEKLYPVRFNWVPLVDTLCISRVLNPDRIGGHSLANWMKVLRLKDKVEQEQWLEFDPKMLTRCKEDTEATELVLGSLTQEMPEGDFSPCEEDYFTLYGMLPEYIQHELHFMKICHGITTKGIHLDQEKCYSFVSKLTSEIQEIDRVLEPLLPDVYKPMPALKNIFKKDGSPTAKMTSWIGSGNPYKIIQANDSNQASMERWIVKRPNLGNPNVLREYLLSIGWVPRNDNDAWNFKKIKTPYGKYISVKGPDGKPIRTTPKLPTDDSELEVLKSKSHVFKLMAWRLERAHRLGAITGYVENVRKDDGRIGMGINSCGAVTSRVTHSVVTNIPRVTSFFGREMRSLFMAPQGKVLVGCDMAGLELRILAHYLDSPEFTQMILQGDVHTYLFNHLKGFVSTRDQAKNLTYAFLYGAGYEKLGSMCDIRVHRHLIECGKQVKDIYLQNIPNLKSLLTKLDESLKRTGGFKAVDGRFIRCRSAHAALNTLCQSAGSIAAKYWTNEFKLHSPTSDLIVYMHDELIVETIPEMARQVGETMVNCIRLAGERLKLRVPLTGEYKIGQNWGEIH